MFDQPGYGDLGGTLGFGVGAGRGALAFGDENEALALAGAATMAGRASGQSWRP